MTAINHYTVVLETLSNPFWNQMEIFLFRILCPRQRSIGTGVGLETLGKEGRILPIPASSVEPIFPHAAAHSFPITADFNKAA